MILGDKEVKEVKRFIEGRKFYGLGLSKDHRIQRDLIETLEAKQVEVGWKQQRLDEALSLIKKLKGFVTEQEGIQLINDFLSK